MVLLLPVVLLGCSGSNSTQQSVDPTKQTTICTTCPTFGPGQDTLQYVNLLRNFLAQRVDAGLMQNTLCENYNDVMLDTFPVQQYLDIFEKDEGTASSGLCSKLMVKILMENGLDAYSYSFGTRENKPHTVVLVKHGKQLWVVDPQINYTLVNLNGQPMDLFLLIAQVAQNKLNCTVSSDLVEADLLVDHAIAKRKFAMFMEDKACLKLLDGAVSIRDSVSKTLLTRCFECEKKRPCLNVISSIEEQLKQHTGLTDFKEALVLKRTTIIGASDAVEMDARIEATIYSQAGLAQRVRGHRFN